MKPKALKKDAVDLLKAVADKQAALTCIHPQLHFERYGAIIRCVDCKRRWFVCMSDDFDLPDFTYGNPRIGNNETRHSPFEAQRTAPRKEAVRYKMGR